MEMTKEIAIKSTVYSVTGKGNKATKKVEKIAEFLEAEFNKPGVNLGYTKFLERFAAWNDNSMTVDAASMDLHKDINTACYIVAKKIAAAGDEGAIIPAMITTKEGKTIICTKRASEFDNVFYDNIDAESAAAEKKAKKEAAKKEQEKAIAPSDAVAIDFDAMMAQGANVTPILLNLIARYKDCIDFNAVQNAIDNVTLKSAIIVEAA